MLVSICIITLNRPQGLSRLLEGLNKLVFPDFPNINIEVIVVDNNTQGLAAQICSQFEQAGFPWTLKGGVEEQRGISYARNKSLSLVAPNADFVAIIDDDERPQPNWLNALLLAQKNYQADIVAGPVNSVYEQNTPEWIVAGNFFNDQHFEEGERRDVAFTNNVLIKGKIIRDLDQLFDNRFALTGGEDSEFFMRLNDMNYKIFWTEKAIVEEWVSAKKTNLFWILTSGYRCWSTHSFLEKELYPSWRIQIIRLIKGTALIVLGLLKILLASLTFATRGKNKLARPLLSIFRGTGTFAGLLGVSNYKLYKTPSPTSISSFGYGWSTAKRD